MAMKGQLGGCFEQMFDYDTLSPSVAKFLRGQAERIRHGCTTSITQTGKALIEAKRHLSHGAFVDWIRSEVGIPVRTAQAYMQVAQWAKGKGASVARLPPSILYVLSGRNTPEEFTAKLLSRYDAGEQIDARQTREELRALRDLKRKPAGSTGEFRGPGEPVVSPTVVSQAHVENRGIIDRFVDILVRGLSPTEFEEVRNIMTRRCVLEDPDLARHITDAFMVVGAPSPRLKYEVPRHVDEGACQAA